MSSLALLRRAQVSGVMEEFLKDVDDSSPGLDEVKDMERLLIGL